MKIPLFGAIFLLVVALAGCATTNIKDGVLGQEGTGLFGFVVKTNWGGNSNPLLAKITLRYSGPSGVSGMFAMSSKDDLFLASLPEGDYSFSQIDFGTYYFPLDEGSRFRVEKGRLTYGGDVTVNIDLKFLGVQGKDISVVDHSDAFKQRLALEYPKTAEKHDPATRLLGLIPKRE